MFVACYICNRTHSYVYIYICVCVFIFIFIYLFVYLFVYIFIYTYLFIYTHILTYTYQRKFRSLNSVIQNSVILKNWQGKNSIITITTIITSPPHHLCTTSPHHLITTSPSPHHLTSSPHRHITTSPHPHITSSPHHLITTSPIPSSRRHWWGWNPTFSRITKTRSGDDVGNLVRATGVALARLPSDASYTLRLQSGFQFALVARRWLEIAVWRWRG